MDAREVLIIIIGIKKSLALAKCIEEGVSHMWTVSAIQEHPKASIGWRSHLGSNLANTSRASLYVTKTRRQSFGLKRSSTLRASCRPEKSSPFQVVRTGRNARLSWHSRTEVGIRFHDGQ